MSATVPEAGGDPGLYGLLAEFESPDALLAAAARVRDEGYTRWDAFAPFPVHGLNEAMGIRPTRLPWLVLAGGIAGSSGGLMLEWWTNAFDYPYPISGKPFFSLPAFVPIMFEMTILFSALCAFLGMLLFNGFPRWYHPLFRRRRFRHATSDRFFVVIEADDPRFEIERTEELLRSLRPSAVEWVEG